MAFSADPSGSLTREVPTVSLPDDHDVYHGNIWGAGGRKAEVSEPPQGTQGSPQQMGQDSGGYIMPADWVRIVERTQSSHLPGDTDAGHIDQGIPVHFGHLLWGGVSFAILEDRKWKSAPKTLMPDARIVNGWPQNPLWNPATEGDVAGAQLLGERQERFLERWARDWDGAQMKAVVSATIFCNLATLPREMMSDAGTPRIPVEPVGGYARNEKVVADHDSNGWPQTPRKWALRTIRACQAIHIAGDQHLGSNVQYGIDDWNDGPFSLCTPAISNIFPRRWFPPVEGKNRAQGQARNLGEFSDGFGNKITVHAVANPARFGITPSALNERAPGFGVVEFDKASRRIIMVNWPRWVDVSKPDAMPYPGWPVTIDESQNGLNGAQFEITLPAKVEGVVEVFAAGATTPVLSWRLPASTDRIHVWADGQYTVKAGKKTYAKLKAQRRA
jgi:alkaline phosphatase D